MRFPGIRSVEQTGQKFRHIRDCLKGEQKGRNKRMTVIVGFFILKGPTKKNRSGQSQEPLVSLGLC